MFNLLPAIEKQSILKDYRTRLLSVALMFLAFTLFWGAMLLLPAYLSSKQREQAMSDSHAVLLKQIASRNQDNFSDTVRLTREKIAILTPKTESIPLSKIIKEIVSLKGASIKFQAFGISISPSGATEVVLSGVAKTRASLLLLTDRLEKSKVFAQVEVPVSNFAKNTDLEFSINLKENQPQ